MFSPEDNVIRLNLAFAYSQKGENDHEPLDYGKAVELLGQVLAREPKNGPPTQKSLRASLAPIPREDSLGEPKSYQG
jgi:hypothetical protein